MSQNALYSFTLIFIIPVVFPAESGKAIQKVQGELEKREEGKNETPLDTKIPLNLLFLGIS